MDSRLSRRVALGIFAAAMAYPAAASRSPDDAVKALQRLETQSGGRLGVAAYDTTSKRSIGHRVDERFGMCSTCKLPLVALLFAEADAGRIDLEKRIALKQADMEQNSPISGPRIGGTMTVRELMRAAQTTSDNMATNLLLREIGGPAGYTAMLRATGDPVTRLDRLEPAMNFVPKGEVRDTTSPRAMALTVGRFLEGGLLSPAARDELVAWMVDTQTGQKRLRAGLPQAWKAGDKTGTGNGKGMAAKYNDVAAVWPGQGRGAVIVSAYYETVGEQFEMTDRDQAVLADAARALVGWMQG